MPTPRVWMTPAAYGDRSHIAASLIVVPVFREAKRIVARSPPFISEEAKARRFASRPSQPTLSLIGAP